MGTGEFNAGGVTLRPTNIPSSLTVCLPSSLFLRLHTQLFVNQERGVADKKLLPYFPYRDDGEKT